MKNWKTFFEESLDQDRIKAQFKPGSYLWRMFIFSLVGAISTGVIYNFIYQYLGRTRAATENVTVTAGASKNLVALNEEFTVNILFAGANASKISQLDMKLNLTPESGGAVDYIPTKISSSPVGSSATNYFDSIVLERPAADTSNVRVVFSSQKPETELTDKVVVKMTFKGKSNGFVNFSVDENAIEVVGPGGENIPTAFSIGAGSNVNTRVEIGAGPSATPVPSATLVPSGAITPTPGNPTGPVTIIPLTPSIILSPTGTTTGVPSPTSSVPTPTSVLPTIVVPTQPPQPTITIAPPPGCNANQAKSCNDSAKTVSMIFIDTYNS